MDRDDLKKGFGAFVRTAMQGLDSVQKVVVQKSKAGRIQIDVAMLRRKRKDALADLGAAVAELAASGKLREDQYPELSGPLSALEALDERIADEEERARRIGTPDGDAAAVEEERFDDAKDTLDKDDPGE